MSEKNTIIETFGIAPSTNIIDVLANSGYSLETAIADIIDNSISAGADSISISYRFNNDEDDYVLITDNGKGMTLDELKEAAILANISKNEKREEFDLGRYSLGLKSASMSFCDRLYLSSKVENGEINTICMDFDHIRNNGKWEASVVDHDLLEKNAKNGTAVLWKKLKLYDKNSFDRNQINRKLYSLQEHLGHTFSDFICMKC